MSLTLCADCAAQSLDTLSPDGRRALLEEITRGHIRLTLFPGNCTHARRAGHQQTPRPILEELPPSARA